MTFMSVGSSGVTSFVSTRIDLSHFTGFDWRQIYTRHLKKKHLIKILMPVKEYDRVTFFWFFPNYWSALKFIDLGYHLHDQEIMANSLSIIYLHLQPSIKNRLSENTIFFRHLVTKTNNDMYEITNSKRQALSVDHSR